MELTLIKVLQLALSNRAGVCNMAIPANGFGVFGHLLSSNDSIYCEDEGVI